MSKGKRGFGGPRRRGVRRKQRLGNKGGKGVILDLKKRTQARELRKQQVAAKKAGYTPESIAEEMQAVSNLLVTTFREEDVNPYAAMSGMGLLLVKMALTDGRTKEEFLAQMEGLFDEAQSRPGDAS